MKIANYNQMKSWLVRPDNKTPEQRAALEAKKDAAEIERKNKKRAEYGLPSIEGGKPNPLDATGKRLVKYSETYDSPVLHDPISNSFKTENQIKNEVEQQQKHVVDTLNDFEDLPEKLVVPKKISNTQPQRLTKQNNLNTSAPPKKPIPKVKKISTPIQIDTTMPNLNLLSSVVEDQPIRTPEARSNTLVENDPKYRNTIFGSDTYYRRKRGI